MNKEQLSNAAKTKIEAFEFEGGTVYIRELNGSEMIEFANDVDENMTNIEGSMILLVHTLCTKNRKRYYTAKERHILDGWGSSVIRPMIEIAQRVNGMGQEQEEIAKN